jgi:uncharacterized protein
MAARRLAMVPPLATLGPPDYTGGMTTARPSATQPPVPRRLTIVSDGLRLAGLLFMPAATPPAGALLVCHGAGSTKENHAVMAEQARDGGLAALVFDFRGHGESEGAMDASGAHDVAAAARALLAESGAPWVAVRGSSMGAHWALRAAAADRDLFRSLVALCPADSASLLRALDWAREARAAHDPDADAFGRLDQQSLRPLLESSELTDVAAGLPRVLLAHARDDESVPFASSRCLAAVLAEPKRFMALATGGHRGPQRSPRVARATIDWVLEHA